MRTLHSSLRFFYKYTPLPNLIVENDPRRKILPFLAWWERLKATHGFPPQALAERHFTPTAMAERHFPP
jgi:hypothetical protein